MLPTPSPPPPPNWTPSSPIATLRSCELSHDLAIFLTDIGFADVRVLVNGWTVWQAAVSPTKKAGAAHEGGIAWHDRRRSNWVFLVCRLLLGMIFVYASYDKILHPQGLRPVRLQLPDPARRGCQPYSLDPARLELLLGLCRCSA